MQVKFINITLLQQLQGDTGVNTSATNNITLLHDFQPFEKPEEVSIFLSNNDSSDVVSHTATKERLYL